MHNFHFNGKCCCFYYLAIYVHVNKRYFLFYALEKGKVLKLISWKHSFKRLNEEYEIAKKKKQALDNLFENGRISQATRDSFDSDINAVIMEIEKQQRDLVTKMQGKTHELESQIKTLETLLANYEIQHVVGEIDEDMYQREITLLSTGLESARNELNVIKEATNQLCPPVEAPATEPVLPVEENEVEASETETEETVSEAPVEQEIAAETCPPEAVVAMEETVPEAPITENMYIAPEETPQIMEEAPVMEEAPEVVANQPEMTQEMPQTTEYTPQEIIEDQPQVTEDVAQDIDESPEMSEDIPEAAEELSETVEVADNMEIAEDIAQPEEETPQVIENEPQIVETLQTVEETLTEDHTSEAPKEAPHEINVEVIADEDQSDEETAETAEADNETEYEEI